MRRHIVHLEAREQASDEVIDALMDAVQEHSGVVAGGPGFKTLSVTLVVDADTPMDAVSRGAIAVSQAAAKSGLPIREFIHCEADQAEATMARYPRK
jgi:hypothetical protein